MSNMPTNDANSPAPAPATMHPMQRRITIALWSVLFLVVIAVLILKLTSSHHLDLPVLFHASAFSLVDQEGHPLSATDLRGKAYVCDFIFTTCGSACPIMTDKLADVQKKTPAALQLVSFTVNPEHDKPAVLKEYGASHGADFSRWHFLTGQPAAMATVAVDMKIQKPDEPNPTVNHSEKFFLVDGDGNVRGIYNSEDAEAMNALVRDASWLASTSGAKGK